MELVRMNRVLGSLVILEVYTIRLLILEIVLLIEQHYYDVQYRNDCNP